MVSGPRLWSRPEKFTRGSRYEADGAAGSSTPSRTGPSSNGLSDGSALRNFLVGSCLAVRSELERPDLDQARVQLAGVGELVGVGDAAVVHGLQVLVHLLRRGVAGVDALQENVGRVVRHIAV